MSRKKTTSLFFAILFLAIFSFLPESDRQVFIKVFQQVTSSPLETVLGIKDATSTTKGIKVTKVTDGDTIELENGQKVRYIGLDTPETRHPTKGVECFGKQAFEKNKELVEGKEVTLEKDVSETDRYGRLLRFVYVNGIFINDYLIREGYAQVSTYPPDVKRSEQFRLAEQEAREKNKGLWAQCK